MEFEKQRVITAADTLIDENVIPITDFACARSAGGLHDYYSEGDYWWPDPVNPEGPYIRRDGMTNPENFTAHRKAMRRLSQIVPVLVAAYKITLNPKYADAAIKHLSAWFINEKTRMNPNLMYAQAIKGRVTGRGIGIIDTIHLVEVARAIEVLEQLGYLKSSDSKGLKNWFNDYLSWMTSHPYGLAEKNNGNNHSTCWAMQVAEFSRLTGNKSQLDSVQMFYKNILLNQMAPDGSFPKEMARTKPYGYMLFNLDAMAMVCQIASTQSVNLWDFSTRDSLNMKKAMNYMFPYIQDKSLWPLEPDVMYFEYWPVRHPSLYFAGCAYKVSKYLELWKTLNPDPVEDEIIRNFPIRQPALWVD